jgi:iron complex transport system ATP-binding protein
MSLEATDVTYRVRDRTLLEGVSLSVAPGELVALLGPNGAGKSTLMKTFAGELSPAAGSVRLDGSPVHGSCLAWLASRRAVMTQASAVVFDFTVEEVLEMGWSPNEHLGAPARRDAMARVVRWADLAPLMDRHFNVLSGGEQQRVQFARALLQIWPAIGGTDGEPRYLLLDEPVASLDLSHELLLMSTVRRLVHEARVGALVVLHDLNLAARFADRLLLLRGGRVAGQGTPEEVLQPDLLGEVYEVPVFVERMAAVDRLVVTT